MNRWRQKHPDFGKPTKRAPTTYGELTDDAEVAEAAKGVWSEAEEHRERVKAKDATAKARRKAGRRV